MTPLPKPRHTLRLVLLGGFAITTLLFLGAPGALAQQDFKTPQDAVDALITAARTGEDKALLAVLGPSGDDIISSGDTVADATARKGFVESYELQTLNRDERRAQGDFDHRRQGLSISDSDRARQKRHVVV